MYNSFGPEYDFYAKQRLDFVERFTFILYK